MQLDSHRRQPSNSYMMPCRFSRRCQAASNDGLPPTISASAAEDWKTVRRSNVKMMRRQTRNIVLMMALMEAMRVGPVQMVYAGRHGYTEPGKEDFGIAYTTGYILSWLYVCVFMIIFVPLFSWWVPTTTSDTTKTVTSKIANALKSFNMFLLPIVIGICLVEHAYYTMCTLIYVDSSPSLSRGALCKNLKKNWLVRFFLLLGIAISTSFGYGAFTILEQCDLAKVKTLEYAIIVVPMQINFGMLLGSIMQFKMERRNQMKQAKALEAAKNEQVLVADEKEALLEV